MGNLNRDVLESIVKRVHYLMIQMIHIANHRKEKVKGDPKVGGHPAACASALHIMGAIHLIAKSGFDHVVNKPHASPVDHSYNYLLRQFFHEDGTAFSDEEANRVMHCLRAFPQESQSQAQPVFQSYHSAYDPDYHGFLPSGTVGIPPVNAGYLALAYRYAEKHGYKVPDAHFWCLMGDSEFREGSLFEAIPEFAERQLGNLTWILDYNRQSLDGHRMNNKNIMDGTDDIRIERTMEANGWNVIQIRHGALRQSLFKKKGGETFQKLIEDTLEDYELQAILMVKDIKSLKKGLIHSHPDLKDFLKNVSDRELYEGFRDFGGHNIITIADALEESKKDPLKPTMIICHTLKGWQMDAAAMPGNHSSLPTAKEVDKLREAQGISQEQLFSHFADFSKEDKFLRQRGTSILKEVQNEKKLKESNILFFREIMENFGKLPDSLDINLKMASYPHTQWMLGQLTAKLTRIANTPLDETKLQEKQKPLSDFEKSWKLPSEVLVSMAPDVGTSTNLNPAMNGKIFGAEISTDHEAEMNVKDRNTPDLVQHENNSSRYIRFEIAEANTMSCVGSFGKIRDILGIPLLPLMTVYDFFIKRALDQYFYNMYWRSSFILVGTPSGVTLSSEGAQHGWKSDIQIPNQITWEPAFCIELDWILCDAIKRHMTFNNEGRNGVVIRGVTRGIEQKNLIKYLRQQTRFKNNWDGREITHHDFPMDNSTDESSLPCIDDLSIMEQLRQDVLAGAYYLIDYRHYSSYDPGDNVINIFVMGSMVTEGVKASESLLQKGIYANIIVVTSSDLLVGNLGHDNDYSHLKHGLNINGNLHLNSDNATSSEEFQTMAGRRVPVVSVHDGEPGLLDNIGSILGVKQQTLAVRKHSRCGRPDDIYQYHSINHQAIVEAVEKVLSETALEMVLAK